MSRLTQLFILLILAQLARAQDPNQVSTQILFSTAAYSLTEEHMEQLDTMFPLPSDWVVDDISIVARADARGDATQNMTLSELRAKAVFAYLKSQHLDLLTYTIKPLGEEDPLKGQPLEANRMVSITITLVKAWPPPKEEVIKSLFKEEFVNEASDEKPAIDSKWQPEEAKVFTLDNVEFLPSSTAYSGKSKKALKELYTFLNENPTARIRIDGHTNIGTSNALQNNTSRAVRKRFGSLEGLALERAKAIRDYLTEKGVAANRIEVKGWGARKPLFPRPKSEGEHSANRRIEVVVIEV